MNPKRLTALVLALLLMVSVCPAMAVAPAAVTSANFDLVVNVFEWGCGTTAIVIDLGEGNAIAYDAVSSDGSDFSVHAKKIVPRQNTVSYDGDRPITNAYVTDSNNVGYINLPDALPAPLTSGAGRYIVLELAYGFGGITRDGGPGVGEIVTTSGELYGCQAQGYDQSNFFLDMTYTVTLKESVAGIEPDAAFVYNKTVMPLYDDFKMVQNPVEGYENQNYRVYIPESEKALPLVLWNHGGGEEYQGDGPGNRGAQLFANMGGIGWVINAPEDAVVLAPQRNPRPGRSTVGAPGYSRAGVIAYINYLVSQGIVDANRVYISGPSGGGQETYRYLGEFPDMWAAAIPHCPSASLSGAFTGTGVGEPSTISPETGLQNMAGAGFPIWLAVAKTEGAGIYNNIRDAYTTLKDAGAEVYITENPYVYGTEEGFKFGETREYTGHWTWIQVANNETFTRRDTEYSAKIMDWLFAQDKSNSKNDLSLIAKVYDYGQDIIAAVIDLGEGNSVNTADLDPEDFAVSAVNSQAGTVRYDGVRNVVGVYANSEAEVVDGEKPTSGRYIIIELWHGFNAQDSTYNNGATALYSSRQLDLNYTVEVSNVNARVNGTHLRKSDVYGEYVDQLIVDEFTHEITADGLNYYMYQPEFSGDEKVPVVVWLHGGGETAYRENGVEMFTGGPIRGNKGGVGWVEAMKADSKYKAIVVAPQSNAGVSFTWNNTDPAARRDDERIDKMLKEIIAQYGDRVDVNRIYVAGCSNGGAQTLSSLIYSKTTPGAVQFAASMPTCPSLSWIERGGGRRQMTDAEAEAIKDIPLWFFNAKTDSTVNYIYTEGTANHLKDINGADIRLTLYEKLEGNGLEGLGEYAGHWSWTMVLGNNPAGITYTDYTRPFDWLFAQTNEEDINATLTSSISKIVAGYAANIPATLTFAGEPAALTIALVDPNGAVVKTIPASENGKYVLSITTDQAIAGTYTIKALNGEAVVAQTQLECVAPPTDLWVPVVTVSEGKTIVTFASDVTFNAAKKAVMIGGAAVANSMVTVAGAIVTIDQAAENGQKVVISGVKYADLFPSYSFTFTLTYSG